MRDATVLLLVAFLFIASLRYFKIAVYGYWWIAIFRPQDWAYSDYRSLRFSLIFSVLVVVLSVINRRSPKLDSPLAVYLFLFIGLELLANVLNGCADTPAIRTTTAFDFVILFAMVLFSSRSLESTRDIYILVAVIAMSLGFHSGKGGLFAMTTGGNFYGMSHLSGFLTGSNAYAFATSMIVFLLLFLAITANRKVLSEVGFSDTSAKLMAKLKYFYLLIAFGSVYNVVALQSRGSFLGLIIAFLVWLYLNGKLSKYVLIFLIIGPTALAVLPLPEGFEERIMSSFAEKEEMDVSAASRPDLWRTAVQMSLHHPMGVGPGCYPEYYQDYDITGGKYGYYRSVHSSHFQILADVGYPGLLVWILILAKTIRVLLGIRREALNKLAGDCNSKFYLQISNALIAMYVAYLLGGAFYEVAYNDIIWIGFGIVIALEKVFQDEKTKMDIGMSRESPGN